MVRGRTHKVVGTAAHQSTRRIDTPHATMNAGARGHQFSARGNVGAIWQGSKKIRACACSKTCPILRKKPASGLGHCSTVSVDSSLGTTRSILILKPSRFIPGCFSTNSLLVVRICSYPLSVISLMKNQKTYPQSQSYHRAVGLPSHFLKIDLLKIICHMQTPNLSVILLVINKVRVVFNSPEFPFFLHIRQSINQTSWIKLDGNQKRGIRPHSFHEFRRICWKAFKIKKLSA